MKKRVLWQQNKNKKQKGDWQGLEILSYCIGLVVTI